MSESTRIALLSSLLAATPTAAIGLYLWWGERFTGLVMAFFFAFHGIAAGRYLGSVNSRKRLRAALPWLVSVFFVAVVQWILGAILREVMALVGMFVFMAMVVFVHYRSEGTGVSD